MLLVVLVKYIDCRVESHSNNADDGDGDGDGDEDVTSAVVNCNEGRTETNEIKFDIFSFVVFISYNISI